VTVRAGFRPGDIALDHTVQEAWLRASVGDTAAAERQLDLVLEALPTLGVQSVRESAQAAAIGRAMVLRADLAAAKKNTVVARRWSGAVLDLWAGSDQALKPTLDRMHLLAGR
jgi:ParB-like chromosome segregation protein Spo0J